VRAFLTYGTYRLLGALAGPLPPAMGYGLGRPVGALLLATSPQLRRILTCNFSHVLGPDASEEQVQSLVRRACANIIKGHYDLFRLSKLSREEIMGMTRVEGREHMDQALARGKGVILFSAHYGNVDILIQAPLASGVSLSTPVEHIQPERLFQYTLRLRTSHGLRMFPTGGPMMGLYRALKRGEVIGLAADRAIDVSTRLRACPKDPCGWPFVQEPRWFLGLASGSPTTPFWLALSLHWSCLILATVRRTLLPGWRWWWMYWSESSPSNPSNGCSPSLSGQWMGAMAPHECLVQTHRA
jgi:predicted LPLAT superfamily acyltransferase